MYHKVVELTEDNAILLELCIAEQGKDSINNVFESFDDFIEKLKLKFPNPGTYLVHCFSRVYTGIHYSHEKKIKLIKYGILMFGYCTDLVNIKYVSKTEEVKAVVTHKNDYYVNIENINWWV